MEGLIPEPYAAYAQRVLSGVGERIAFTRASDVAEAVWDAVHDTTGRLRFPAGADALAMAAAA